MASSSAASNSASSPVLRRKSNDVGWEYGALVDPNNLDKVKCKLCSKTFSGGVYRMKEHIGHISGNVAKCPKSSKEDQEKCRQAILEARIKKKKKEKDVSEVREGVNIGGDEEEEIREIEGLESRPPRHRSPLDRWTVTTPPDSSVSDGKTMRQQSINEALFKEKTHNVKRYVAKWVYESGIPFNVVDNDSFIAMLEAVGQYGPGFKPPTQYELREPLLKEEVESLKVSLQQHELEWKENGCSIMTDAWSDRKRRSIMNLCVNCRIGTTFLSSKESSDEAHTAQHIFEYVLKGIEQVGSENVVQVVTDNASNNMAAAKLLKAKMPNIFWSSCATHTINLMLESIGKLPRYKKTIDSAKAFTIFVYAHHKTLSMMRSFTKKRDIVRPGVTRFASAFLTLQSLIEKKESLRTMFASTEWDECIWSKQAKGKAAFATVMSVSFWNGVTQCLKVFAPLVRVLRLVDGDRKPSMGFVYGELKKAKEEIKEALNNIESNYRSILEIMDTRIEGRLDTPLHAFAYLLNPYYYYKDASIEYDVNVMDGVFTVVEAFFPNDIDMQSKVINEELASYKSKDDAFGREVATKACGVPIDVFNPGENKVFILII